MHMLKSKYQSWMHTHSWDVSIKLSRLDAQKVLRENPTLKPQLKFILDEAYERARLEASNETGLSEETFPEECPWEVDEIMEMKTAPKMTHTNQRRLGNNCVK